MALIDYNNGTATISVNGGQPPFSYLLTQDGSAATHNGANFVNPIVSSSQSVVFGDASDMTGSYGMPAGTYKCIITDDNGCSVTTSDIVISNTPEATTTQATAATTQATAATTQATAATTLATAATTLATPATTLATAATTLATNATTLATPATTLATNATTLATNATTLATPATTLATAATTLATNATTLATDATTLATPATTLATAATTLATPATTLATAATTLATAATTLATPATTLTAFDCTAAGFTVADGIAGETIILNTDATVSEGTLNSVTPTTYQLGETAYTANITVPPTDPNGNAYSYPGYSLSICTDTATGIAATTLATAATTLATAATTLATPATTLATNATTLATTIAPLEHTFYHLHAGGGSVAPYSDLSAGGTFYLSTGASTQDLSVLMADLIVNGDGQTNGNGVAMPSVNSFEFSGPITGNDCGQSWESELSTAGTGVNFFWLAVPNNTDFTENLITDGVLQYDCNGSPYNANNRTAFTYNAESYWLYKLAAAPSSNAQTYGFK